MLETVVIIVSSTLFGALAGGWVGWQLAGRLSGRLAARKATLEAILELENRRVGYDSGRQDLARSGAGRRPARVLDGMDTKAGILAQHLAVGRDTKKSSDPTG